MTVNKTNKTHKTAKKGEALTTVGIRLSKSEIEAINDQVAKTGRSKSDVLRTIIKAGLAMLPPGLDIVALNEMIVREYMGIFRGDCLAEELQRLMLSEIQRYRMQQALKERREKIKQYNIVEVGE